jgi:acylglycerol lipase
MTSSTDHRRNRRGSNRLERHWAPPGPPVAALVLVHGINEHSGRYEHFGGALAARGIDVLAYDLPGHGGSAGRRGHIDRFDVLLDDVEDLLAERRALGVPVVLFGHSLGGLIAVVYAESERPPPDLLALSAPALVSTTRTSLRRAASVLGRVTPRLGIPTGLEPTMLSRDDAVVRAYVTDPLRLSRTTARFGLEIFATQVTAAAAIDRITIPTWVMHGDEDGIVPLAASDALAALPNVTRRVCPGLRHECFNEPEGPEVIDALASWILDQVKDG